jgi:hypothetical protein
MFHRIRKPPPAPTGPRLPFRHLSHFALMYHVDRRRFNTPSASVIELVREHGIIREIRENGVDLGIIPDGLPLDDNAQTEGRSWCLRCRAVTAHRRETVEFLGNAVRANFYCLKCGGRIHPGAMDHQTARRRSAEGRRLRIAAGLTVAVMLLIPVVLVALLGWMLWRFF